MSVGMASEARSLPRVLSGFLAVLLILAMVVLSSWADQKEREIVGPSVVKTGPEGRVFVVSHGALWILESKGSLSASVPLEDLDIHGRVSDVLPMGGSEILIAERGSARGPGLVHRCHLSERACVPFTTDARGARLEGSFELAANDDRSQVYLAHTTRHAIHLFDRSGTWLATSDALGLYKFPHRPLVVAGALYVADTNHRRLVAIEREPARFGDEVDSFSTETSLGRRGRVYPIAHRRLPDGTWWVVIGDMRLQYADIIVFDDAGRPLRRLGLPEGASPVALEVVGDRVLAPDPLNLRVDAFTLAGQPVGEFGDAAFRGQLTRLRALKSTFRWLRYGSWAALGVLLLSLVAIRLSSIRSNERRTWLWPLAAALLALVSASAIGLAVLWAGGALYEDLIGLMVVYVGPSAVMFGILIGRLAASRAGQRRPTGGR
jgi:hypothetical protein